MNAEERLILYATFFHTVGGQQILEDLKKTASRPSYEPGMKDPERETFYREGQRSVLLGIEAAIAAGLTLMDGSLDSRQGPTQTAILDESEDS